MSNSAALKTPAVFQGPPGPTGAAGPIAGLDKQVIYNNSGSAAGAIGFEYAAGVLSVPTGISFGSLTSPANQITFKQTKFIENGNTKGTSTNNHTNVQTTNATVTVIDSGAIPTGVSVIDTVVVAVKSDYTAGASFKRSMTFLNNGGVITAIGSVTDGGTKETNPAWDSTIDSSGTTWRATVTGVAATTITWYCVSRIQSVAP